MQSMNMFNKEFPNGWVVEVKFNGSGFGELYETNYQYSVRTSKPDHGFTSLTNIQYASEVFKYIAQVMDY